MIKRTGGMVLMFIFLFGIAASFAAVKKEGESMGGVAVGKGGTLSFNLKDADVKTVLQFFAKHLKKNIVAGEGVTGKVSLSFTNVKPQEGLEAVLRARGFDWFQEGDTLVVSNQKTVRTYLLQYASASEIKTALELLMTKDDQVSVNDSYNALIVKTSSDNISRIERSIRDMDIPPIQVLVETKIIELRSGDLGTAGLEMGVSYPKNPNVKASTKRLAGKETDASAIGFYAQVITSNVQAYLNAMMTKVGYDIVAAPRIATINHKTAMILIGSKIGYRTTLTTQTGTLQQVSFLETGTKLTITPHVSDDGYIRMVIAPKVSEGYVSDDLPTENTTETLTEVLVKSGQTIVIGGLTRNKETQTEVGIPLLMDIPIVGMLFKRTAIDNEKRELLVVLTPRIMTPEYLTEMQGKIKEVVKGQEDQGSSLIH